MDINYLSKVESEIKNDNVEKVIEEKPKKHKKHHQHHSKRQENSVLIGKEKDSIRAHCEVKKMNRSKKESKPVEVIDKEKFNSLRAMFDKKNEKSKLDNNSYKLSLEPNLPVFTDKENIQLAANFQDKSEGGKGSLSEGIKRRMENLFSSNKTNFKQHAFVDPVLEHIKVRSSLENKIEEDNQEDDDYEVYSENSDFESEGEKLSDPRDTANEDKSVKFEDDQADLNDDNSYINKIPALDAEKNEHIFHMKDDQTNIKKK